MIYKIIVDKQPSTNPSADKREYTVDIEELRAKGNVYDSLVITKDESYVIRRLSLSEYQVLSVLEEEIKEPLTDLNITLFEGDNYIYLLDVTGNKFYAEYLVKNDFNDIYCTRNEMNSAIVQTASQIELNVNQKLTGYSTTEEMNAAISAKAGEINLEVQKKVDDEKLTGANIILRINNDKSEAKMNADKIELSATDILNLLAGNTINLTSKNIVISSNNFSVDKDGKMTCTKATMNSASILGGQIDLVQLGAYAFRYFANSSKDTSYMAYIAENIFGINNGSDRIEIACQGSGPKIDVYRSGSSSTIVKYDGITTPTLTQTSKESVKKNIEEYKENALDIIKKIDIYKYNLKSENDETKKHIGFVIGENYNYREEVTSNNNDGVDLYSFVSLCCQAIKEQQEKIEELERRLEEKANG